MKPYVSRNIIAVFPGSPGTKHTSCDQEGKGLGLIWTDLTAVKVNGVSASDIVKHHLLHVAVRCFNLNALEVILTGHVHDVDGVTDPVLSEEAPLYLVVLPECLVVDVLH